MDRRRAALVLLLGFIALTGVAIVLSGSRPGLQQGIAPTVVQFAGYLLAGLALMVATVRLARGVAPAGRAG